MFGVLQSLGPNSEDQTHGTETTPFKNTPAGNWAGRARIEARGFLCMPLPAPLATRPEAWYPREKRATLAKSLARLVAKPSIIGGKDHQKGTARITSITSLNYPHHHHTKDDVSLVPPGGVLRLKSWWVFSRWLSSPEFSKAGGTTASFFAFLSSCSKLSIRLD